MSGNDWCTIESDPGVFTELLSELGCDTVELEELYSLDDDALTRLQSQTGKVYGLIFLFKWVGATQKEHAVNKKPVEDDDIPPNLFFAHQVTTNACATQAILSVVLNAALEPSVLGSTLSDFHSFTSSFPPMLKGEAVGSSQEIKTAHNAFGRQDAFLQEGKVHAPSADDEAFHFVAYVPVDGTVYELDGLQKGPIVVGSVDETMSDDTDIATDTNVKNDAWLSIARAAIQERMVAGGDHVKFNLMAVIEDKRVKLQKDLVSLDNTSMQYTETMEALAQESHKREQWKVENQRRRHNYVPLCMQLLKELAKQGTLPKLVEEAAARQTVKRQKRAVETSK